jgi:carbamoyl-phosphate synthase large subunit
MNRHLAAAIARLTMTIAFVFIAFGLLHEPSRRFEARMVAWTMSTLGIGGVGRVYGPKILVLPAHKPAFLATVTPSCSALAAVLTFLAIATFLLHGPLGRRMFAVLAAAGVVIACNIVRIGLSLAVGLHTGSHGMVVFHDWVGTIFGMFYVLAGFTLFVFMLLPSNKRLLEASYGS